MIILRLEELETGMVLAQPVRDLSGRLLLGANEAISPRTLRIFRMWGVTEAAILPPANNTAPKPAPVRHGMPVRPAVMARAAALFSLTDRTHPLMAELFQQCLRHCKDQLEGE